MGEHMTNPLNLPGSQSNPFSFASRRADAEALTQHWREDEQQGARNSLLRPELADAFESQFRLESFEEITTRIAAKEKLSGDALYKRVYQEVVTVNENIQFPKTVKESVDITMGRSGCFIKGTGVLVKGENGKEYQWRRIEEIQPGDWVLSAPEDGKGKPEYKRVTNVFEIKKQKIRVIGVLHDGSRSTLNSAVTDNHPYWVEGIGWVSAESLKIGDKLRKFDGSCAEVSSNKEVYKFRTEEEILAGKEATGTIGWFRKGTTWPPFANPAGGELIDFGDWLSDYHPNYGEMDWDEMDEDNRLEVTVYNIEVEDFHTYYVNEFIWVHNAACANEAIIESRVPGQQA